MTIAQGSRRVAEYALKMTCGDEPLSLDSLIDLSIHLYHLLHSRHPRLEMGGSQRVELPPEPMQLGWTKLCEEERERQLHDHHCVFCSSPDHLVGQYLLHTRAAVIS